MRPSFTDQRCAAATPAVAASGLATGADGVAGHAGLFSTTSDLAKYARMVLGEGTLGNAKKGGVVILSAKTCREWTQAREIPGGHRSYGWDIDSAYSSNRGSIFPKILSFGHTGFTGTGLWTDFERGRAWTLLTNRVHPTRHFDSGIFVLRRQVGDAGLRSANRVSRCEAQQQSALAAIDQHLGKQFHRLVDHRRHLAPLPEGADAAHLEAGDALGVGGQAADVKDATKKGAEKVEQGAKKIKESAKK